MRELESFICYFIFEECIFEKLDVITDKENDEFNSVYGMIDMFWIGCLIYLIV